MKYYIHISKGVMKPSPDIYNCRMGEPHSGLGFGGVVTEDEQVMKPVLKIPTREELARIVAKFADSQEVRVELPLENVSPFCFLVYNMGSLICRPCR